MRRVIVVTDGDCTALGAVEAAAENVGARCISLTACRNPKDIHWSPKDVEELVLSTPRDPVVVLVDDEGAQGEGWGEQVLRHLCTSDRVKLLGVVAVASNLKEGHGIPVDASVAVDGSVVLAAVDKEGVPRAIHEFLRGDTVENLDQLNVPVVIGLGDPGKMNFQDEAENGAPLTTRAVQGVLEGLANFRPAE